MSFLHTRNLQCCQSRVLLVLSVNFSKTYAKVLMLVLVFSECAVCCDCSVLGWFRLLPFSLPFWPCSGHLQLLLPPCLPHLSPVHPHSGPRWRQNGSWEEDFTFLFCAQCFLPDAQTSWDSMLTQLSCCISSPPCHTRLHRELPVAEENEDPQDSLHDCYLTSSFGHDPPDTCRPYTSASFTFDKQETFLGLDVDGKYSHREGHNIPGWG